MKNHNQYNGGIADVWYSGKKDLWIEYKFVALPKRSETLIDLIGGKAPMLSHLQQNWIRSRHAEGRSVGVLVGSKEGGVWFSGTTWDNTQSCADYKARILDRKGVATLICKLVG